MDDRIKDRLLGEERRLFEAQPVLVEFTGNEAVEVA